MTVLYGASFQWTGLACKGSPGLAILQYGTKLPRTKAPRAAAGPNLGPKLVIHLFPPTPQSWAIPSCPAQLLIDRQTLNCFSFLPFSSYPARQRKAGRTEGLRLRRAARYVFTRPGGPALPGGRQRRQAMVDGLEMAVHETAVYGGADCCQERESEDSVSEQCYEQEAVEYHRG